MWYAVPSWKETMQPLSATQAISPAVERTRDLLFRPFQWGTFLKLCAVAVFTEGASSNFNNHTGSTHSHAYSGGGMPFNPAMIPLIAAIVLAAVVIAIVVFYFVVRLRFALFDCLIHQSKLIAPGWHRYRDQAFRFFLLSIGVGIVFVFALVVTMLPFIKGFWHVYQQSKLDGNFPNGELVALVLQFIPLILVFALAGVCVDVVMRDFMLPHYALEDASAGQAWIAVYDRVTREPGAFFLYALLRIVLPFVAIIALTIALIIPGLIVFGSLGLMFAGLHSAASNGSGPLAWLFMGIVGFVMLVLAVFAAICVGGPLSIAIRNYALVFYGGRYPALGSILSPPEIPGAATA
jgi:multisubunit Na+/H+ antiporter MnhC subunit